PHHLHSFPTRRSSDLAILCFQVEPAQLRKRGDTFFQQRRSSPRTELPALTALCRPPRPNSRALPHFRGPAHIGCRRIFLDLSVRSEEHTSELQSRSDL